MTNLVFSSFFSAMVQIRVSGVQENSVIQRSALKEDRLRSAVGIQHATAFNVQKKIVHFFAFLVAGKEWRQKMRLRTFLKTDHVRNGCFHPFPPHANPFDSPHYDSL